MAITSMSDLRDALPGREISVRKFPVGDAGLGGYLQDLWSFAWEAGTHPTTATRPGRQTAGSLLRGTPDGTGQYLGALKRVTEPGANIGNTLILYDRLFHMAGFVATAGTPVNVDPTPTVPVDRGPGFDGIAGNAGQDCEIAIYIVTTPATTARNVTATYTNDQGVTGRVTQSIAWPTSNQQPGRLTLLPLASGDRGVRSVQSVTWSSAATGGNYGVAIIRRLCEVPLRPGIDVDNYDAFDLGMPLVYPGMCLSAMQQHSVGVANASQPAFDLIVVE